MVCPFSPGVMGSTFLVLSVTCRPDTRGERELTKKLSYLCNYVYLFISLKPKMTISINITKHALSFLYR